MKLKFGFFFILVLVGLLVLTACSQSALKQVCINTHCFNVDLAKTPQAQEIGLMNRTHLDSDKGMLFVFDKEYPYGFWMKNTLVPLDILWIDSNKTIVYIQKDAEPCKVENCPTYIPNKPAKYVLEINGDLSEEYGFKEGKPVIFNNI